MIKSKIIAIASKGPLDGTHVYQVGDAIQIDNLASIAGNFPDLKVGSKLRGCSPHAVETMQTLGIDEMIRLNMNLDRNNEYTVVSIDCSGDTKTIHMTYRLIPQEQTE